MTAERRYAALDRTDIVDCRPPYKRRQPDLRRKHQTAAADTHHTRKAKFVQELWILQQIPNFEHVWCIGNTED